MQIKYIQRIISSYLGQKTSFKEEKALNQWFLYLEKKPLPHNEEQLNTIKQSIFEKIQLHKDRNIGTAERKVTVLWRFIGGAAAMLTMGIGLLYFFTIAPKDYYTAANENKRIELSDGSIVLLQENSRLHIATNFYWSSYRKVELSYGQAFFEIHRDPKRPFIVKGGKMQTEVLGTSFKIRNYSGERYWHIAVKTGRVRIFDPQDPEMEFTLTADDSLTYDRFNDRADVFLYNQTTDLIFKEANLEEIARKLEAKYGVNIVLEPGIENTHGFSGEFKSSESVRNVINMICIATGTTYQIIGKEIIIKLQHK